RSAIARAISGETPSGSPDGVRPVTSRKLPMLMAARSTPCGASSETTDWDMVRNPEDEDAALYRTISNPQAGGHRDHVRSPQRICIAQRPVISSVPHFRVDSRKR